MIIPQSKVSSMEPSHSVFKDHALAKDPIRGNCSRLNTQGKEGDFIDKDPLSKDSSVQNPAVTSLLLAMWKSLGPFRNKC